MPIPRDQSVIQDRPDAPAPSASPAVVASEEYAAAPHAALLLAAARLLEGLQPGLGVAGPAAALLGVLGMEAEGGPDVAAEPASGTTRRQLAALLRLGSRFLRLFRLTAPDAPGLHAWGAEIDLAAAAGEPAGAMPIAGASGVGVTALAALRACLGEGAELLASIETPADRAAMRPTPPADAASDQPLDAMLAALPWPDGRMETCWLPARRLTDGASVWLPREIVLRAAAKHRTFASPWPLSIGCAAGPTLAHAALHGLLELIERDAVALWWRGGRRPRAVALEGRTQVRAAQLLAQLRGGMAERRRSWLLDITTDLGVPVVAAVSFAPDGSGFCCGTAARSDGLAAAAEAALLEMAQMELAWHLTERKAHARGEAALNAHDRAHRARFAGMDAARCALLHPARPPAASETDGWAVSASSAESAAAALDRLVQHLAQQGFAPLLLDLRRPGEELPVVRICCPGLEAQGDWCVGARLSRVIAETGGGDGHTGGIRLT
jgi:ribosomal protein S12 methylthiotransferase accessory factor